MECAARYRNPLRWVVLLLAGWLVLAAACGSPQRPPCDLPEQGDLLIYATDRLNPDESGRSLPTIVRIYQLTDVSNLQFASFEQVWRDPEGILGDTLVKAEEITIYPGQHAYRAFERDATANYLVGVAIVRRPVGVSWRSVLELPMNASERRCAAMQSEDEGPPLPQISRVMFRVDGYRIEGEVQLEASGGCPQGRCITDRAQEAPEGLPEGAPEGAQGGEGVQAPEAPGPPGGSFLVVPPPSLQPGAEPAWPPLVRLPARA